ncbi:SusC/RagA family TonB-linked outer membrane protein [Chryseosolibacter histidini]|nr:TonB-dependent receptor [Chryseosolibacter histidini]
MTHIYIRFLQQLRMAILGILLIMVMPVLVKAQVSVQSGTADRIRGVVTDATDSSPLVGANVLIKSTTRGTITDVNGSFALDAGPGDVLVISFIGYVTQEVVVEQQSVINVALQANASALQEIVVVGYGEQKKENLSGAVDAMDSKALEARPIQNIAQGLQGAVPNLNVDFLSGEPGTTPNINIRGFTSINGGNPLILVDNVPLDAAELNFIAPSDIKSISILKDASSAAIYGARAAYGVILITTKSGIRDGITIDYTNNFSWGKPTVLPNKITDPYIYMRMLETSTDNTPWDYVNYTAEEYAWARQRSDDPSSSGPVRINPTDNSLWQYMGNRDWTKYFLDNYTVSQRHNVSVSGKSGNTSYYLSGAYDSQNGALNVTEDKFDRYAMRGKINFKPFSWLALGNNTSISLTERSKPSHLSIQDLFNIFPTSWDRNPDGTWANTDAGRTMAGLTNGGRVTNKTNMLQTTFSGEVSAMDRALRLNADFTARRIDVNGDSSRTKYNIGFGPNDVREEGSNTAYRQSSYLSYYVFNTYGTFEKKFGDHALNLILGYNQEYQRSEWFQAQRSGVISSSLPTIGLATGEARVDEEIADWAIRGAFYRLNYIFKDKYIVELNGRYDGSSKFPKSDRFGFFPSASAAWKFDGEQFWESLRPVISTFKIRASYGSLGNQFVGEYGYIATMNAAPGRYLIGGNVPQVVSAAPLVSSNYTWEKVYTRNLGVDLGFLQQRISASFDIYQRDTKGMLTQGRDLPDVLGTAEPDENAADLETKGWELSLGYDNEFSVKSKPLHFNARFTLADSRSYITRFDNPNGSLTQYYEGKQLGEIWGLQSDGFFKDQSEIDALNQTSIIPWGALTIVPGWPRYKDLDGNHEIEKGTTVKNPKDLSVIGNITPRLRVGFNLGAEWGGFDIRVFLQGVAKMDYYPLHYLYWGAYQQPYAGGYVHLMDYYRATSESDVERAQHSQSYLAAGLADANTDAAFPVLQAWLADRNLGERIDEAQGLAIPQTKYMLNGAYLRLKNLTIGYTLPSALLDRLKISKLRIYASGENITEWSALKKYFDPESVTDNIGKLDPSYQSSNGWGYAYPFQRRYSFGLELQF